jgi:hypothetical protein
MRTDWDDIHAKAGIPIPLRKSAGRDPGTLDVCLQNGVQVNCAVYSTVIGEMPDIPHPLWTRISGIHEKTVHCSA